MQLAGRDLEHASGGGEGEGVWSWRIDRIPSLPNNCN